MWGSKGQTQHGEDVHASYADPRASLLVGCLDQSVWTPTVRLAASAADTCAWLASQPNIHLDASSEYAAEWRAGTARFRFQLLEVPPIDRKDAAFWERRWKKRPHRLFVACLLESDGQTEGITFVGRAVGRMAANLDGQYLMDNNDQGKQALKREMKAAHAVALAGIDPSQPAPPPRSAESDALEAELTSVPMTSAEKPDINGFREGERVRLIDVFVGERQRYEIGREGTVLVTNTSPAHVRLCRQADLHEVLMDGGGIVMTGGKTLEKISGYAEVIYSPDGETVYRK